MTRAFDLTMRQRLAAFAIVRRSPRGRTLNVVLKSAPTAEISGTTIDVMTLNNFTKALTSHQSRRPFVQYDIELSSGSILRVKHPDALAFLGKRAVVITPDGLTRMFDDESVTQITETQEPAEKSAKDGPAIKETS